MTTLHYVEVTGVTGQLYRCSSAQLFWLARQIWPPPNASTQGELIPFTVGSHLLVWTPLWGCILTQSHAAVISPSPHRLDVHSWQ